MITKFGTRGEEMKHSVSVWTGGTSGRRVYGSSLLAKAKMSGAVVRLARLDTTLVAGRAVTLSFLKQRTSQCLHQYSRGFLHIGDRDLAPGSAP